MSDTRPIRVFAVASGKGGVGKTNVAVNLGVALALRGRQTALLDADMGLANVDILLGLQPRYNLSHVISGQRSLDEILVEGPAGIKIVPAASGLQQMAELSSMEQAGLIRAFSELQVPLEVLIVDTAAGISGTVVNFARACQEIVVVVCDEPTSLTDAYAFIKLLNRDYGIYHFQILCNQMRSDAQGRELFAKLCRVTERYLDVSLHYFGAVPYDDKVRQAVQLQRPVVTAFPASPAARAIEKLADKVEQWPVQDTPSGQLAFFFERMIQYAVEGAA
ncbi:MinD/ParA family protein [Methylomarinovum caldicuralii]|uniref:MinD/ParA family protein n=1 Tax=Methylomarinovum caldicuralii TaxID=438856 RepID=UPI003BF5861A